MVCASWGRLAGEGWRVTSIERTAYPQFRRLTSARVRHVYFTPTAEEIGWAQERTASPESLPPLTAGNLKAPGPDSSPARGLVLPGQASGSLMHPEQARHLQDRLLFRTTVLASP
jgi:hypothetical protein